METEKLHPSTADEIALVTGDGDPRTGKASVPKLEKATPSKNRDRQKVCFQNKILNVYFEEETCNHEKFYQH